MGVSYTVGQPTGWLTAALSAIAAPSTLALAPSTGSLTAATYSARVEVSSVAASNSPQTVNVTFTVAPGPSPTTGLSSTSRSFSSTEGGDNPAAQQVAISNAGGGTLTGLATNVSYTTGQPSGWLNASLSTTTAPSTLTLTATTGSLAAGTYAATVAVSSAVASNSPQDVGITITLTASLAPPAAPSDLTAQAISSTQIELRWTDNSTNELGFRIHRCDVNPDCTDPRKLAQ